MDLLEQRTMNLLSTKDIKLTNITVFEKQKLLHDSGIERSVIGVLAAISSSPSSPASPSEKSTTDMPKSSSTQLKTPDGHNDAPIETGNGDPEAVHDKQQDSQLNEIADDIRACREIIEVFNVLFPKLWVLGGLRNGEESYPFNTASQDALLSAKDELTSQIAKRLQKVARRIG